MAAPQHDLGLPIESAQELAFPAVPHAGADGADVGNGEGDQHFEPFLRLDDRGQAFGGARVGDVAALRRVGHDQMLLDEPGDVVGAGRRQPEAGTQPARHLGARLRMVARPALGDVVEEGAEIELGAMDDLVDELADERAFLLMSAGLDLAERPNGADEMFIDRVVVIHRELHHPDDPAEIGNEAAEDACFVHPSQRRLRGAARRQDLKEKAVGFRVLAQASIDPLQRLGDEPRRVRMDRQVRAVCDPEDAQEIDRVTLEHVLPDDVDSVVLDPKVPGVGDDARPPTPESPEETVEDRSRLGLPLLERRGNDRRQVADVLRHEEIVLHETLDVGLSGAGRIAELAGDWPLYVEAQALLRPAGQEVQVAPDRPEKLLAAPEERELARREQAGLDQVVRAPYPIDVFRDPKKRVEVAQSPFAFLDVGLDEIARCAGPLHPLLTLGELGGNEFRRGLRHDLPVEAHFQRLEERVVAGDQPRLDQRGADRHVGASLFQALVDRPRRVTDFLFEVPQHVEQGFDYFFHRRRRLVRHEEQKVDVGARRQHAASVTADRNDGWRRSVRRWGRKPADRHFEDHAEQIVDLGAQRFGAGSAGPARFESPARLVSSGGKRSLKIRDRRTAKSGRIVCMVLVQGGEIL